MSVRSSSGLKIGKLPRKKFINLLKSPRKRDNAMHFQTLQRADSASSKGSGRRRTKIIPCASGFQSEKSPRKQEEGKITKVTSSDSKDIQYVYNPFASMVLAEGPSSTADSIRDPVPNPSPANISMCVSLNRIREDGSLDEDAEAACRSFEGHLVEMVAEERRVSDLIEVEELVKSWGELRSPVFSDMVFEFYVDMCKDLFMGDEQDDIRGDGDESEEEDETRSCPGDLNL